MLEHNFFFNLNYFKLFEMCSFHTQKRFGWNETSEVSWWADIGTSCYCWLLFLSSVSCALIHVTSQVARSQSQELVCLWMLALYHLDHAFLLRYWHLVTTVNILSRLKEQRALCSLFYGDHLLPAITDFLSDLIPNNIQAGIRDTDPIPLKMFNLSV